MAKKVMLVFGTRPEAIKMCPLVKEFQKHPDEFKTIVCVTGQHRAMLDQVLNIFDVKPDYDLNIMKQGQDLTDITARVLIGLRDLFKEYRPDVVLVHGDTTTSTAGALAAFYAQIPVGHVEAGLRTHNLYSPWPEEMNRQVIGRIANYDFAPTPLSEKNLKEENVHGEILILPLRLLNQSNGYHSLYSVGGQAFISLFNGIDNLNDYFAKCNSIDDIIRFAREDIGRLVMFSEDDNVMLPFGERFRGALSGTKYMVDRAKPDSYNFFILVFGCIQQAIDVLVSCIEYGCIPYIRYPVSLHYISLLSESMLDIEHIVKLRFKMSVAFVVYQLCDKGRLARVSLEEFLKQIQAYNFNEKLFRVLAEHDINDNSFLGHTITQLVIDELEAFYNILSEESGI
mgnify:CR=1 FL=1